MKEKRDKSSGFVHDAQAQSVQTQPTNPHERCHKYQRERESCGTSSAGFSLVEKMPNFGGGSNPFSRRKFIGVTTAATGFSLLGMGKHAFASGNSPHMRTEWRFKLKCKTAPQMDDCNVAWTQAPNWQGEFTERNARVDASGPASSAESYSALVPITASVTGHEEIVPQSATMSATAKLGFLNNSGDPDDTHDPYTGEWLLETEDSPSKYYEVTGAGPNTGSTTMNVNGPALSFGVAHAAGAIFESLAISSATHVGDEKKYYTNQTENKESHGDALIDIESNYQGNAALNTNKIGFESQLNIGGKVNVSGGGSSNSGSNYERTAGQSGTAAWEEVGTFSGNLTASFSALWEIVVQKQSRIMQKNSADPNAPWEEVPGSRTGWTDSE